MARLCYDGINSDAALIPADAQMVAGYVDGLYAWSAADWARFPHAVRIEIAVHATTDAGIVLDVEQGDATPEQAVNWVLMRRAAGADPTVYCNQMNTWPQVRAAFQHHDVPEPHYWVAKYDNDPRIPVGAVAKQYQSSNNWDLSSVADYWPGVDPALSSAPHPAPSPNPQSQEADMPYYPIQVLPDSNGTLNACGVASWPAGAVHVVQIVEDLGLYGETSGSYRLAFSLLTGPDVVTEHVTGPAQSGVVELASVPGLNPALCRGVTITRPDGHKTPWGGGAE